MDKTSPQTGNVGPFWVLEADGRVAIIALAISVVKAEPYGDMLTVEMGHLDHWSQLARRGSRALREAGLPTAPVWSEYEEWPRGRVLYDRAAGRFVIRADRQLHRPDFVRLILDRFAITSNDAMILPDDHYQSVRRLPVFPRC
jgi:hypothetical protein